MSGGRARRRKQKAWRRTQAHPRSRAWSCPHCGSTEPHFIPPSFGDPGFYACSLVAAQPSESEPT